MVGKAPKSGGAASTATAGKAAPVAKDPKKETPKSIRGGGAGKKTEKVRLEFLLVGFVCLFLDGLCFSLCVGVGLICMGSF